LQCQHYFGIQNDIPKFFYPTQIEILLPFLEYCSGFQAECIISLVFKNENNISLSIGAVLLLVALIMGAILPLMGLHVEKGWIWFSAAGGFGLALVNSDNQTLIIIALALLVISAISFVAVIF